MPSPIDRFTESQLYRSLTAINLSKTLYSSWFAAEKPIGYRRRNSVVACPCGYSLHVVHPLSYFPPRRAHSTLSQPRP